MKRTLGLLLVLGVLATSGAAYAGGSTLKSGYSGSAGAIVQAPTKKKSPPTTVPTGSLPFTGMDLGFVAAAGVALTAAGFGLRRFSRQ
jgi:hypothetical protein